jgi:putative sigma-54 modulation protein
MQVTVTGRHIDITDAIRHYTEDKIAHDLADFDRVESVHVILNLEKYRHLAEVVIQGKGPLHLEAEEESDDMYASIDLAVEKAAKQLRKHRDKVQDHKSKSIAEVEVEIQQREENP